VADAVAVERVSTPSFPANREINRKFLRIRSLYEILKADTRANPAAFSEIPYSTKQGIISAEQGILAQEQGILPATWKSPPDEIFGTHTRRSIPAYFPPSVGEPGRSHSEPARQTRLQQDLVRDSGADRSRRWHWFASTAWLHSPAYSSTFGRAQRAPHAFSWAAGWRLS